MKQVRYVGSATKATVDKYVWNGHGDVQEVTNEVADNVANDSRFEVLEGDEEGGGEQLSLDTSEGDEDES